MNEETITPNEIFREWLKAEGLVVTFGCEHKHFSFPINMGYIFVLADPEIVHRVVTLAHKFAEGKNYEEHLALLSLVADRTKLDKYGVAWQRAHHVNLTSGNWVTLEEWLSENGYSFKKAS